jgi:6,7-dimethyl-8-ribityllumazine synthase
MATAQQVPLNLDVVPSAAALRIAIVVSEWNNEITENLFQGARAVLEQKNCTDILRINVPGSLELVYGCKLAMDADYDAIIALGSVIRGETPHFDYVCEAVALGIKDLNLQGKSPVIFGVLTDDTLSQAQARSGGKLGNKGVEAAVAAIMMAKLAI